MAISNVVLSGGVGPTATIPYFLTEGLGSFGGGPTPPPVAVTTRPGPSDGTWDGYISHAKHKDQKPNYENLMLLLLLMDD